MLASPQIAVDVYPQEGGQYYVQGGQVLSATISKPLQGVGTASIILAPGGPTGQGYPSWSQIITLQSIVIVALSRGNHSNVVFVGYVTETSEAQEWEAGRRVTRVTRIEAVDWMGWFVAWNWTALSYLGAVNGNQVSEITGTPTGTGIPDIYFGGDISANPALIANDWFTKIMGGVGSNSGVLANTKLNFNGGLVTWPSATASNFEAYPYQANFPASSYFVSENGSWYGKFTSILEAPFYEIIIGTAPTKTWDITITGQSYSTAGVYFTSSMASATPAIPAIVGRVNPLPDLNLSGSTQGSQSLAGQTAQTFSSANLDRWNQLPAFTPDEGLSSFIASQVSNTISDYANFFVLDPIAVKQILGIPMNGTLLYAYSGAADIAGIHRYGLIDRQWPTHWMADPGQVVAQGDPQTTQSNVEKLMNALTTRLATYFMPTPLMENAQVVLPLRPDIFVGCRFSYAPFRGDYPWMFYINGVSHSFQFGGPSTTTLSLERGLPTTIYSNSGNIYQLLLGNCQRKNGGFTFGAPPNGDPGLQVFGMATSSLQRVLGQIASVYVTPGQR